MFSIPQGDTNSNQPNNVVHGSVQYNISTPANKLSGVVPEGVFTIWVTIVGGGGGGNNSNFSSGGAGGYFYKQALPVAPGTRWDVTIGAGGTGGNFGFVGNASTFVCGGNTLNALAGQGGAVVPAGSSGANGTLANGTSVTGYQGGFGDTIGTSTGGIPGGVGLGTFGSGGSYLTVGGGQAGIPGFCMVEW